MSRNRATPLAPAYLTSAVVLAGRAACAGVSTRGEARKWKRPCYPPDQPGVLARSVNGGPRFV